VDGDGLVTFNGAEGEVRIKATAADGSGMFAEQTIKVAKNVTGIRTPLTKVFLQRGKGMTLPVVLDDSSAPDKTVSSKLTWVSSNPKVLTVSASGAVKAASSVKKKTAVKVTVTAANGKSLTVAVTVVPKAEKLKGISVKAPKTMKVGGMVQLGVKLKKASATGVSVTYKATPGSVIRVDKAGKLFALKKGKATVVVKAGGKSVKKVIVVK
jgi:hypothetical protein